MKEILTFLAIIIVLWVMWISSGGPESEGTKKGPFLTPPITTQSENGDVFITNIIAAKEPNPNREYIEIVASRTNTSDINISGWKLRNSLGKEIEVARADKLAYVGKLNNEEDLLLSPGERVIITTGSSPVGVSFQVNKCSGYLEQFQDFNPALRQNCPRPEEAAKNQLTDQSCISHISTFPKCEIYIKQIQIGLSNECLDYINDNINHNSCIDEHKNDSDFYSNEWRIFLGYNTEFWDNTSDLIRLYNTSGKLIDSVAY